MAYQRVRFSSRRSPFIGRVNPGIKSVVTPITVKRDTVHKASYADTSRLEFTIQNTSAGEILVDFDRAPTAGSSMVIPAGGSYGPTIVSGHSAIYIKGTLTTDQRVILVESKR